MKKIAATVLAVFLIAIAAIAVTTFSYLDSPDPVTSTFPEKTVINGVDCSGLTCEQAETKISEAWNSRHIQVTCNLNVQETSFTDFGYEYDLTDQLNTAKKRHPVAFALNRFFGSPAHINIPMTISGYDTEFKKEVFNASVFDIKNPVESHSAYVDLSDPDFPIIHQTYGTEPDMERVFSDLTHSICMGDLNFVFDEKKYFIMPEVTADDTDLIAYQKFCQKYLGQKITYELGDETFTISAEQLSKLMKSDMSGKADKKAVQKYVSELANDYDNIYVTREFVSLTGKEISVPPGTYGWKIDQEAETNKLISNIESHKDISRKPVYAVSGYGEYTRDMGDTYIDVDISEQMVRYYKNGKLAFSSECVTGNRANGTTTEVGAFYILNKIRNVVLRGDNGDGTEYENFVSYWMGVNWSGEGFHDATWRRYFGGSIWIYNGSHGCINMPPSRIPEFYEQVEVGIPVAVHY